jgi:hypothetical protein
MQPLVGALRDALQRIGSEGRVPREIAKRLRSAVIEHRGRREMTSSSELIEGLPAFDTLSEAARQTLLATVVSDDWWSMAFRRAYWRQALTRAIRTAVLRIPRRYRRSRALLEQLELVLLYWQARVVHVLYRKALTWTGWRSRTPKLAAALAIAGLDARAIASSYVRGAPQPLDTAGYWHDASRHATVGVVLGIDFIVNDEGVWFVESNLNAGLTEERSSLYATDPFVMNMVRFAQQNGYNSMVFLACNDFSVDDMMAARLEQAALDAGLQATVFEDRYAPQRRLPQTFLVPPPSVRTLVVRSKMFHTSFDALFHHKRLSYHAIERYQRAFADHDVRLPPSGAGSIPASIAMKGPFPNLVCKFPERDQGQGVFFLRVPSLARAKAIIADTAEMNRHSVANIWTKLRYRFKLEEQEPIFQTYVPSSLLEGRRLSIARAHVLATPVGIQFLSAHRIVSNRPVPASLAEGLVTDPAPFIVNYSLDSEHALMPREEERMVEKAALSVARALCCAVESRFQISPDALGSREEPVSCGWSGHGTSYGRQHAAP